MTESHISLARPPAFTYRAAGRLSSALCCDQVPLAGLARKFGTPLYVYSASAIRNRYLAFDQAFCSVPHTVCYSVKANSNISILRLLGKLGCGFDVVSGGELERVRRVSRGALKQVVFSGVGKTAGELDAALESGILLFNVESEGELELLVARAAHLRKTARVAVRVNPDVSAKTHPYIATGLQQHKFGVAVREARPLYRRAAREKYLQVAGVSTHIGSQIVSVEPFAEAMERVASLVRALQSDGHQIRYVDAGGGLGISYHAHHAHPHAAASNEGTLIEDFNAVFAERATAYARAVTAPFAGMGVHFILEPGRAIVGPAGVLLTRVLYLKNTGKKKFLVVDGAMNDLLRPSLYGAYHEIAPVRQVNLRNKHSMFDVVGPICETGDFFARDRLLPSVRPGDLLAVLDAGAYGMVLSSNYNTRPRPAEVLVDGPQVRLIRKRDSIADLVKNES